MQNNVIPTALAPHVKQCLRHPSLTLLASVLDTPVNWLVSRFVVAALRGDENAVTPSPIHGVAASDTRIILVSFWRSYGMWSDSLRKNVSSGTHYCHI